MKLGQGRNDARNGSERSRTGRKGVGKGSGMDQLQERILEVFCRTREQGPLVQCITNFVTVNDCANVILAAGGSPSMAHDIRERQWRERQPLSAIWARLRTLMR